MADNRLRPQWSWAHFNELAAGDLYDIIALRTAVFIVEQRCAYQDPDGADRVSHHLWTRQSDGGIGAYLRVVPPNTKYVEASLGRIATSISSRRTGLGRALVQEGIARLSTMYGDVPIRIGAQKYLFNFYQEFGFTSTGYEYNEDGIPHVEMLRP